MQQNTCARTSKDNRRTDNEVVTQWARWCRPPLMVVVLLVANLPD